MVGTGSIILSENLELKTILHVPNLDCNLLSVSKLSQEINYVAKFSSDLCEFQVLDSGKMIGSARVSSGLYLLKVDRPPRRQTHTVGLVSVENTNKDSSIML